MQDTSTYTGLSGEIANQHMGCAADYERYLAGRCDSHVQVWLMHMSFRSGR
jgi:hypothetical protein